MKLKVTIHTEEEFDWDAGFYPQNNSVTHGNELIVFCEEILDEGVNIILAMDYAFIQSDSGKRVVDHFKDNCQVEFASHLHPWVNPPLSSEESQPVSEHDSYPGNLPEPVERAKLTALTEAIERLTGKRPTTYLAGRYGVGVNSYKILADLGYTKDLSITAFADFRHQQGPDFSQYDNQSRTIEGIHCVPHTTGYISSIQNFSNYLNSRVAVLPNLNRFFLGKVLLKLLGVKRVRLSPEGFTFSEMKKLTESLSALGVEEFIFSFHSPSVKPGLTPYVQSKNELEQFKQNTLAYLRWFPVSKLKQRQNLISGQLD